MNRVLKTLMVMLMFVIATPAMARLNVFACEPEWQALATELGGDRVTAYAATTAYQDPHHIEARPSLIARLRNADLLICSGAELEVGWLPMLQRQAANPKVLPGKPGYFEASAFVERLGIPDSIDRSMGDVHGAGNPHVHLDPRRVAQIADALSARLIEIDPASSDAYRQRHTDFRQRWQQAIDRWQQQAAPLKDKRVVVHHMDWLYLFDWLGIRTAGALEPKPGLPATAGHLANLKQRLTTAPAQLIVHTAYQSPRAATRLGQMTGIPVVELPYTVGGAEGTGDLFGLFEVTVARLLGAIK